MQLYNLTELKSKRRRLRQDSTFTEKLIWRRVRNNQMCGVKFRRQYSIDHFVLDFYAPQIRLAIELDGISHDDEDSNQRDAWRQRIIEEYKVQFIRFTDTEVNINIDVVLSKIEAKVKELLGDPAQPHPNPLLSKEREFKKDPLSFTRRGLG